MPDMNSYNATGARDNLFGLIRAVNESHRPIHIRGKSGDAVLLSADDWRAVEESLALASVPGLVASVKESEKEPLSEMPNADDLEW